MGAYTGLGRILPGSEGSWERSDRVLNILQLKETVLRF